MNNQTDVYAGEARWQKGLQGAATIESCMVGWIGKPNRGMGITDQAK